MEDCENGGPNLNRGETPIIQN